MLEMLKSDSIAWALVSSEFITRFPMTLWAGLPDTVTWARDKMEWT